MRIGLLGGSFNPIHCAHLRIAREAQSAGRLERVIFIPAADPPHKILAGAVPFATRCRMVQLAIAGHTDFELSTIEGQRGGKSYSIDTIHILQAAYPDDELFFIIGSDSFLEIGSWHRYADIFRSCSLIVVERPGCQATDRLGSLPPGVRGEFRYDPESDRLLHQSGTSISFVAGRPHDLSSTEIRRLAASGASLEQFVPATVAAYISQQRIYHP